MKKSILMLVLVLAFSFAFSVSSFAYDTTVTLSEDYSTLYLNGKTYSKANTEAVDLEVYADGQAYTADIGVEENVDFNVNYREKLSLELTDTQKAELTKAYVTTLGEAKLFADVELYFKDGTTIWHSYVRDDVKDDFNKIKNGDTDEYVINFDTYSDNGGISKKVSKEKLLTGDMGKVYYFDSEEFDVVINSEKYGYSVIMGCIFIDVDYTNNENSYYYFDFSETGIITSYDLYEFDNITTITAHKITDEETIAIIEEGLDEYYNSDFGYLYNDDFTEPVAKIFFIVVFAIFPLAVAVTTLVLALKSKKSLYKKLLFTTSGLSLATLAVFVYIAFTLFNK